VLADIAVSEVGLVAKNGKLEDVLAPGSRKLYWKGAVTVAVEKLRWRERWRCRGGGQRLRQLGVLERMSWR